MSEDLVLCAGTLRAVSLADVKRMIGDYNAALLFDTWPRPSRSGGAAAPRRAR